MLFAADAKDDMSTVTVEASWFRQRCVINFVWSSTRNCKPCPDDSAMLRNHPHKGAGIQSGISKHRTQTRSPTRCMCDNEGDKQCTMPSRTFLLLNLFSPELQLKALRPSSGFAVAFARNKGKYNRMKALSSCPSARKSSSNESWAVS